MLSQVQCTNRPGKTCRAAADDAKIEFIRHAVPPSGRIG
jgi:hypothetical protein